MSILKLNLAHKERFYVGFDEYQVNRPENRLIKSTLLKLQRISAAVQKTVKKLGSFL
jgi:5-methylcytosine-specific restriction enzyme subunit McrC